MASESQGAKSAESQGTSSPSQSHELESLQPRWCWLFALGIALITLGIVAIGSSFFVSMVTVVMFGVLLLMGGVAQVINSFWIGKWSGTLLHLLIGIFYIVVGVLIIDAPVRSAVALTLLVAAFLIVGGLFRIVSALVLQFPNWGWPLLNGFIDLLLGILIYKQWPASGLWVIGLFVGIEMMFNGWAWVMLSIDLRNAGKEQAKGALQTGCSGSV